MFDRRLLLAGTVCALVGMGSPAFASDETEAIVEYETQEESTAVTAVSVLSPENLYAWNAPTMVGSGEVVYSAKQWFEGELGDTVSVWRNAATGGAATKLVPAGDGEILFIARSAPASGRIFFGLSCSVFSVEANGAGGRRKHVSSGYCDYGGVPVPAQDKVMFSTCTKGKDCWFQDTNYIWIMNSDDSEMIQLRQGAHPAPSPDGQHIAFSYQGDIWIMGIDGSNVTNITQSGGFDDRWPQWSPDGRRIVFSRYEDLGNGLRANPDIWVVDMDGRNVVQLTMNLASDWGPYWGDDGFIYFISNRGALVNRRYSSRVWRMRLAR